MNAAPQIMSELGQAALDYAARGWFVFPVPPGTKKSHKSAEHSGGRNWGATSDPEEIRRDWARWPDANVGIATGAASGFFVIEADTAAGHGVDGIAALAALIEAHGPLPETIEALSPSGSWHIYFRWPEGCGVRNSAGLITRGVDVRGDGGMIVAAPSVKPGAAQPYRWKNPPPLFDLADCPGWLLDLATRPKAAPGLRIDTGPTGTAWAEAALRGELAAVLAAPQGRRNAALNAAAFSLGQIVAGGGLAEADAAARLTGAALAIGLEAGETVRTIASGMAAGMAAPRWPAIAPAYAQATDADPVDLWGRFDPPALPEGLLPPIIEEFAVVQGARMGSDPAGLAVAALVTCAAAIPDSVKIQVKEHDPHWTESARLWAALVGAPSTKKSPILSAATGPLCRLDVEMFRDWTAEVAAFTATPKDERQGQAAPPQRRLRIEDATVEAAQVVLEGSPWGVLLLQDELSGWFGAMDKYNGGKGANADRGFWLRSFNGGEFALNRVGRGAAIIPNLSVCLLGGIQPDPIRRVAADAQDDGLLQRLFPVILRPATMGRDEPAPDVAATYAGLIEALRGTRPPGWLGNLAVRFDARAQAVRRELEAEHLRLTALESINGKLAAHIGKYDGLFARLCLTWHCIEHAGQKHLPETIGEGLARRVGHFLHRFLLRHALAFYAGTLGLSDDHDRLSALAGFIIARGRETVTGRDVQQSIHAMRGIEDRDVRRLFEQLAALGWLTPTPGPRPSSPPVWRVNPAVHAKFASRATRERERRAEVRETLENLRRGEIC